MRSLVTLTLLLCLNHALLAQGIDITTSTIDAPTATAEVIADPERNRVHLFTLGVDNDFNGVVDQGDGDVPPRWYIINRLGDILDSTTFDGFFDGFPIRVGVDFRGEKLYVPIDNRIQRYNLLSMEREVDTVIAGNYNAVAFDSQRGHLLLSSPASDFVSQGTMTIFNPETSVVVSEFTTGINPVMGFSAVDEETDAFNTYVLNEGVFGQTNANLTYLSSRPEIFADINEEALGGGGSEIIVQGDYAYILLSSTHQLRIIHIPTNTEVPPSPIDIGTEGFDSPRSFVIFDNIMAVVSTYSDDIRRFSLNTGVLVDSITTPGKADAVALHDSILYTTIPFSPGTYETDSLLTITNLNTGIVLDTVVVGPGPQALFVDKRGDLHVIGGGGTNGPGWWKVFDGITYQLIAERSVDGTYSFPARVAYDSVNDNASIVISGSLMTFSASDITSEPTLTYSDEEALGSLFNVSDNGNYYFVSERPNDFLPKPCYIHIVNKEDGRRLAKFETDGEYLMSAVSLPSSDDNELDIYLLHEGNFTSPNATLDRLYYEPQTFEEGELGGVATHILHQKDVSGSYITAVTLNGSHEIAYLDLGLTDGSKPRIGIHVSTETTDLDGPRKSVYTSFFDGLIVTSYSGEAILFSGPLVEERIQLDGRGEGITALDPNTIFVTNLYESGTYTPASTLNIIEFDFFGSVSDRAESAGVHLNRSYPNPAQESVTVDFTIEKGGLTTLTLYGINGQLYRTFLEKHMEAGEYSLSFDIPELSNGIYFYRLQNNGQSTVKAMEVVR